MKMSKAQGTATVTLSVAVEVYGQALNWNATFKRDFILVKRLFAGASAAVLGFSCMPAWADNDLAIGNESKVNSAIDIPINPPAELNWKTQDDVLNMRKHAVAPYRQLLKSSYEPSNDVFGAIEDKKPWWGLAGACVYGEGQRSIEGMAEESRFILNPWLLVAANPNALGVWNSSRITSADVKNPAFPFQWLPESLKIYPRQSYGQVVYNVSKWFNDVVATRKAKGPPMTVTQFSLVAYNARDMGMKYVYLDTAKSLNVTNDSNSHFPIQVPQFIHCGGTCGYPGGCNNMSPFTAQIDRLRYSKLPARAVVHMWREAPPRFGTPPDMTWYIDLK
jgi:hypothetical protein